MSNMSSRYIITRIWSGLKREIGTFKILVNIKGAGLRKKHDLRICDYSGPAGQRGAFMMYNQHENLQWKISVNSTPRSNYIFRCIRDRLGCFVSRDYHERSMVVSGESFTDTFSKTGSSEVFNSKNLIHLRTDNMTALSYLLNMEGTQNKHLIEISKEVWGLSHREKNTFDSRIYAQFEQSNSRMVILKLLGH